MGSKRRLLHDECPTGKMMGAVKQVSLPAPCACSNQQGPPPSFQKNSRLTHAHTAQLCNHRHIFGLLPLSFKRLCWRLEVTAGGVTSAMSCHSSHAQRKGQHRRCTVALTKPTRSCGMSSPEQKTHNFQNNTVLCPTQLYSVFVDLVSASDLQTACALVWTKVTVIMSKMVRGAAGVGTS